MDVFCRGYFRYDLVLVVFIPLRLTEPLCITKCAKDGIPLVELYDFLELLRSDSIKVFIWYTLDWLLISFLILDERSFFVFEELLLLLELSVVLCLRGYFILEPS